MKKHARIQQDSWHIRPVTLTKEFNAESWLSKIASWFIERSCVPRRCLVNILKVESVFSSSVWRTRTMRNSATYRAVRLTSGTEPWFRRDTGRKLRVKGQTGMRGPRKLLFVGFRRERQVSKGSNSSGRGPLIDHTFCERRDIVRFMHACSLIFHASFNSDMHARNS